MIILDYIKTLKKSVDGNTNTFQELLKNTHNHDDIMKHFNNILIKEHKNFIHLKYDAKIMFDVKWDEFYSSARGIVIDWINEEIVLYPFDKFFELDEHSTTKLSVIQKALKKDNIIELTEKIDGSLISMRFYKDEIVIASSGSLVGFHVDKAKEILDMNLETKQFIQEHPEYTIMFEMKNTEYPQLVKYGEDSLSIIGMRHMKTGHILYNKEIKQLVNNKNIKVVPTFDLSLEEILEYIDSPDSKEEGYILRIGNLLVKMKSKNFILANRFKGEPSRNFNVLIEALNENRVEALRPLIREDYIESFDIGIKMIKSYIDSKEGDLKEIYNSLSSYESKDAFIWKVRELYPDKAQMLINMKVGKYKSLDKEDIKYLKKFADYLTCVSSYKYAELNNIPLEEVESKIKNGEIKYLKKFKDSVNNNKTIYIIHKWQFFDVNKVKYN